MSKHIIFERMHRGELLRVTQDTYKGTTFANFRRWYPKDGDWKAGSKGVTMPLDALPALTAALMAYHGLEVPDGLETGS
ncbi:hypothetical protein AQZ52_12585 [Novosphingobium fuchskuhlense]|uniref:Transcriptional coactivator p15 (PC4) C-terminal domain-containing protein n=1 Tax=Novosphingobium fuchskuhlense TaxID=1117702 RepID=A0A124JUP8_9SPHN|nr:transcriptional coactivator p15/PC4 family protein [Novosphingobium fuchskuhlense]KUR71464.1 hypothetical protein AQZ52_12585 [Novosphingobium fuchskuhlense]